MFERKHFLLLLSFLSLKNYGTVVCIIHETLILKLCNLEQQIMVKSHLV